MWDACVVSHGAEVVGRAEDRWHLVELRAIRHGGDEAGRTSRAPVREVADLPSGALARRVFPAAPHRR